MKDQFPSPGINKLDDGLFVASLAKGFRVLECFEGGQAELTFAEIVERAKIGKSAAQRAISTLVTLRYLVRNDARRTYRISHRFLSLTRSFSTGSNLIQASLPALNWLHDQTDETVNVTERSDLDIVFVVRVPGRHAVTISIEVGTRLPVFATAPGLVMLAYEPTDVAQDVLLRSRRTKFTETTLTGLRELQSTLKSIKSDGYFISNQLRFDGEFSIAAPIFGRGDVIIGAANASVPVARWTQSDLQKDLVPLVKAAARQISANMDEL